MKFQHMQSGRRRDQPQPALVGERRYDLVSETPAFVGLIANGVNASTHAFLDRLGHAIYEE